MLIYIGDCFDEDTNDALEFAKQLKLRGVRCFLFHDRSSIAQGYDVANASEVFGEIARITGGALLPCDTLALELVKKMLQEKSKSLPISVAASRADELKYDHIVATFLRN